MNAIMETNRNEYFWIVFINFFPLVGFYFLDWSFISIIQYVFLGALVTILRTKLEKLTLYVFQKKSYRELQQLTEHHRTDTIVLIILYTIATSITAVAYHYILGIAVTQQHFLPGISSVILTLLILHGSKLCFQTIENALTPNEISVSDMHHRITATESECRAQIYSLYLIPFVTPLFVISYLIQNVIVLLIGILVIKMLVELIIFKHKLLTQTLSLQNSTQEFPSKPLSVASVTQSEMSRSIFFLSKQNAVRFVNMFFQLLISGLIVLFVWAILISITQT